MKSRPGLPTRLSVVFASILAGFAAVASDVLPTQQQVARVNGVVLVHQRQAAALMTIPHVVASGVGLDSKGEPVIKVLVTSEDAVTPQSIDGVRVHKELSNRIVAFRGPTCETSGNNICSTSERWPVPVPIGVSVGHPAVTAGTLGARVTDGSNVFILSNNHVIADLNLAVFGDGIVQPGSLDGGANPDDVIATLFDFEPLDFVGPNTIDAGIALSSADEIGFATPTGQFGSVAGYGTPSSTLHPAYGIADSIGDENLGLLLGAAVQKVGRTTRFTSGSVNTINASVSVCYDAPQCSQVAMFVDQIIIGPAGFSAGGDSGSLIVGDDGLNRGVGLLYAGSDTVTIANRIDLVLTRFNVSIDDGSAGGAVCPAPVCDNADTGFNTVGSWASSSRWPGYYASDYAHDKRSGKGGKTASWTYAIAANGSYDVAAQWSAASNRASSVQYMYSVDGGAPQDCGAPVDQRANGGQFNGLCAVSGLVAGSTLTVSLRNDSAGFVIADAVRIELGGNGNSPPMAEFTTGQQPGTLTIDFDGSGSDDPDGSIVSYDWDFGDGTFGTGVAPSHTYAAAGSYDVSLTVTDDRGATDRVAQTVVVQPAGGAVCPAPVCDNADTGFEHGGFMGQFERGGRVTTPATMRMTSARARAGRRRAGPTPSRPTAVVTLRRSGRRHPTARRVCSTCIQSMAVRRRTVVHRWTSVRTAVSSTGCARFQGWLRDRR